MSEESEQQGIPKIIHQIWLGGPVPSRFKHWQASWKRLNPDYDYRLWTDVQAEVLIAHVAPAWRDLYRSYQQTIRKADLLRVLILQAYGGVYADMDYECLMPLDHALEGQQWLAGYEPEKHIWPYIRNAGLEELVCNAWLASRPAHPFWDYLLPLMAEKAGHPKVIEATGPILLTRAVKSYPHSDIELLSASLIYPADQPTCQTGLIEDLELFEAATRDAYGIHYWDSSWARRVSDTEQMGMQNARAKLRGQQDQLVPASARRNEDDQPLISCLMVTRGQPAMVRQSIRGFLAQTYPQTELVIVTDAPEAALVGVRSEYPDARLRWVFVENRGQTLGELRNLSVDKARGEYVAQWDDDDLCDPSRLYAQYETLRQTGAQACLLQRWVVWWPARQRLFLNARRANEGTLLCLRSAMPRYPSKRRGEDTQHAKALFATYAVAMLDLPRLYWPWRLQMQADIEPTSGMSWPRLKPNPIAGYRW